MSKDDIDVDFFKNLIIKKYDEAISTGKSGASVKCFLRKHYPEFHQYIERNFPGDFGKKLYLFVNDLSTPPRCQYCGDKEAIWYGFVRGFGKWCSIGCMDKDPEHRRSVENTMLERYGCKHALQADSIKEKFKGTIGNKKSKPERYERSQAKRVATMRTKYGADNIMQCEEGLRLQRAAVRETYGVEHAMQNLAVKEKVKQRFQEALDKDPDHWIKVKEKREQCYLEKYGTSHPQRDIGLGFEKRRETCVKKYGVEYFTQSHECHKNRRKRVDFDGLTFDSLWEKKVYEFCEEHGLSCEYQPDVQFNYVCCEKVHTYQPDFRINGRLYEVKGDHFFRINEETGKEEMFLPFKTANMTNEQYEEACECFEAKHQCMMEHDVKILRKADMADLTKALLDGNV